MSRLITRISLLMVGLFLAGGLAFGATQAFGSGLASSCGDDLGELGLCPPFNNASCDAECVEENFFGGMCSPYGGPGLCCICLT